MDIQRDFHLSDDADDLTRELGTRLDALDADMAKRAEPFGSSAPVIWESLAWFAGGLIFYACTWLWTTGSGG